MFLIIYFFNPKWSYGFSNQPVVIVSHSDGLPENSFGVHYTMSGHNYVIDDLN
jgi:hypothetical protein